jgi:acyl-CoA oxidase
MSVDLKRERGRSKINIEELASVFVGGEDVRRRRRKCEDIVARNPDFDVSQRPFFSRDEALSSGIKSSIALAKLLRKASKREGSLDPEDAKFLKRATNDTIPITLQWDMFIPTIESQGTDEQKAKWLPPANDLRIFGAYAQTELGHGTFLRGLETTATYDPKTEEFVLNSPTRTSIKWWPGGLGHFTTHAIVVADLITQGKSRGVHPFIVQLRSLEDHTPLPGITVGDIGPKFGYNHNDNGFVEFKNVRIPRDQMLMKFAQVGRDGRYSKPASEKLAYGTMVFVRSFLVRYGADSLSRACTIATRYSAVRRQSQIREDKPEVQILDFVTQQYKLFPLIATSYAFQFAGNNMLRIYIVSRAEMEDGNMDSLPELHATSAGLKAFTSEIASNGIEVCRLSCGGHGYSHASGLPILYANFTGAQTYEGENTVMYLQSARYLMKLFSQRKTSSQLPLNVQYLGSDFVVQIKCSVHTPAQWLDPHQQLDAYRQRARRLVTRAAQRYRKAIQGGAHQGDAWNLASVDLVAAAKAHCHLTVVRYFIEALTLYDFCPENEAIMKTLCDMYCLHGIVECASDFMVDGYLDSSQVELARHQLYKLLPVIRAEAVPLVDAFDHSDLILDSILGCYDGDVYEKMYEWAKNSPTNKDPVHQAYHKYMKNFLKSKL